MPINFINVIRKIGLNAPPIYLSVFGILLAIIGAIFDNLGLIDLGTLLYYRIFSQHPMAIYFQDKNKRKES